VQQTACQNARREDKNPDVGGGGTGLTLEVNEDDVVLCRVKKIEGTTVFLKIEDSKIEGSMVLSEVAAGRIRNLRQYVSPNRLIVCKVLKVTKDHIELSLRRVTSKEREEVLEGYKKEKALRSVLNVVNEDADRIIAQIKAKYGMLNFINEVKTNPKILEEFIGKEKSGKVSLMIAEKEEKEKVVEKRFRLKSFSEQGVRDIREILDVKDAEMHYLGSSVFSISVLGKDFKEANNKLDKILAEIEERAKKKKAVFESVKER
jgi:translation initiation factor 2 alpha subunit (eIF-2alpha)